VGEVATAVKDCFGKLLSNHYVERCPAPEPSLRPKIAVEPPKKTPRGSARGRGASLIAANGAIGEEQRVMSAAAPTDAERFQVPVSLINMGGTDMEMGDTTPIGQKVSEACSMLKVEEPHVFLLTSGFCTDFFFGVSHTASNFLRIQRLRFKLNGSLQDKVQSSPVSN
jgi:hypothetical protein